MSTFSDTPPSYSQAPYGENRSLAEPSHATPSNPKDSALVANVPDSFKNAADRLQFPPSYVVVGAYRLFSDKSLLVPAWEKCRNGAKRGALVGLIWIVLTFGAQRSFIEAFLTKSPRVTGLSNDTIFGYKPPFSLTTYAAVLLAASQVSNIIRFFLSKNIRIARDRAWNQTVASRGKGPEFWQPYVEEWSSPPKMKMKEGKLDKVGSKFGGWLGVMFVKRVLLLPFNFYPFVGVFVAAYLKALGTAKNLHRPYFEAKKMTPYQTSVFMEERKWDYRVFGFAAALLEGIPIIGLVFTVSNRVGAAMWAHDLEKRQHLIRSNQLRKAN
ncbi:hypothetical protein BDV98DRAFT_568128 [Pterulicium gracile]|uniref:Uncharacterized protein n=1 Tax=Pterulicium gracile TaxID=1884261 RepID=A0A5C3QML5_9AGAR|nr:hypothetical protein BDV98DRAFT_568128 [Pterula gracilis]